MKKVFSLVLVALFVPVVSFAGENVRGHWRDTNGDGAKDTYIQSHQRTTLDSYRTNNYNYPGNHNPNSGKVTPYSNSPRTTYPVNPNPYNKKNRY